jgi:hypothetical protein
MAKEKVSVSQHVRDVLSEYPELKAPEIISLLAKQGVTAKPALVYYVNARFRRKKRRQGRQKVAMVMSGASRNGSLDAVAVIVKVKGLATEVGGMSKLKALVEALS